MELTWSPNVKLGDTILRRTELTIQQISQCANIDGARYLSAKFLSAVKKENSKLVEWWHEGMIKEIQKDYFVISEDLQEWTGRWIEPTTDQTNKQDER